MSITQFIFTLYCMVGFALGWRIITSPGKLLYFIRAFFEGIEKDLDIFDSRISVAKSFDKSNSEIQELKVKRGITAIIYAIGTPLVLCITCFASVWGVSVFGALNGLSVALLPYLVIACLSAAFIQTFIWNIYAKYLQ